MPLDLEDLEILNLVFMMAQKCTEKMFFNIVFLKA